MDTRRKRKIHEVGNTHENRSQKIPNSADLTASRNKIYSKTKNRVSFEEEDGEMDSSKYHSNVNMGYQIEPFNLKEERRTGNFHANGSYVFRRVSQKSKITDAWMDNISKQKVSSVEHLSKIARAKRESVGDALELWKAIDALLLEKENVKQAIQRLSGKSKKRENKFSSLPIENALKRDEDKLNNLMEVSNDLLMLHGVHKIYYMTKRDAQAHIKKQELEVQEEQFKLAVANGKCLFVENNSLTQKKWEYKWKFGEDTQKIYGPYTSQEMVKWHLQGYFSGTYAAYIRPVQISQNNACKTKSESKYTSAVRHQESDMLGDLLADFEDDIAEEKGKKLATDDLHSEKTMNEKGWHETTKLIWPTRSFVVANLHSSSSETK